MDKDQVGGYPRRPRQWKWPEGRREVNVREREGEGDNEERGENEWG